MQSFTYTKLIAVSIEIPMPAITFEPVPVNLSSHAKPFKFVMGYSPRFDGLTAKEYVNKIGMKDEDEAISFSEMFTQYMKETYGITVNTFGRWVYSPEILGMPEPPLPKHLEDEESFKEWLNNLTSNK
jgi:hypothetical protein